MFKLSAVKSRLFSDQVLATKKGQIGHAYGFQKKETLFTLNLNEYNNYYYYCCTMKESQIYYNFIPCKVLKVYSMM